MTSNYHEAWDAMNKLQEHSSKLNTIKDLIETATKHNSDQSTVSLLEATSNMIELYVQEFDDLYRVAWDKTITSFYKEESKRFSEAFDDIDTTNDGILLSRDKAIKDKLQNTDQILSCHRDDPSPECKSAWNDFWEDNMPPWGHSDLEALSNYYPHPNQAVYSEEELNAMCDKATSDQEKEKCREYNLREAEYYDKRAELDTKQDRVVKWQLPVDVDGLTGDCFVNLPDDLLERAGLVEGDVVKWIDHGDGSFELRKVNGSK